ncbi:reticulon-3 isoform X3 [Alosa pseudoharengus]|uniref:reticulon-3 isoform X3 n=1 Tax=Alosa pseudoharengus TaxID=34774 RepID=UPI003F8A0B92
MADPMTQSSQISSSQGLADGQNSVKDSKFADSFLSSSPVSLIQSPQDKRVVVGSEKPSEGVATSLRFQPGSFTPVSYGNETTDRSHKGPEKKESSDSNLASPQEDSPIKMSPVSERIKALEALAAKKNEPESRNEGGFPHFRERHYEKSPSEAPPPAAFQKKTTSQEKESPESPFEVLGETVQGTDYEDTADWMRAHLPPAPNFGTEDPDLDDGKDVPVMETDGASKGNKEEAILAAGVPEAFAGVPDAFMDTPIEPPDLKDDYNPEKQESMEEESEFDLNFLPTAYMWDKQENNASKGPPGQSTAKESDISAPPATAPPPAGFGSPSPPLSPPPSPPASPPQAKVPKTTLKGDAEPSETHEIDSSGESDDTVIEDACASIKVSTTESVESTPKHPSSKDSAPSVEKESQPAKLEKQPMQVPIINVIETEEQVVSEEEYEPEEEEDERYRVMRDPVREPTKEQEPTSDEKKAVPSDTPSAEDHKLPNESSQVSTTESVESTPKHPSSKDSGDVDTVVQTTPNSRGLSKEESHDKAVVFERPDSPNESLSESAIKSATEGKEEKSVNITDHRGNLSEDTEPVIDSHLNNFVAQDLSQKEKPKSELISEDDYASDTLSKSNVLPDLNAGSLIDQSYEDHFGDDSLPGLDESSDDRQLNFDTVPEPSPSDFSSDNYIETLVSQNISNVGNDDSKTVTNSGDLPLMADDNYTSHPVEEQPSMQEYPQDDFSYYSDQPDSFPGMDLEPNQDSKDMTAEPVAPTENTSDPESIEPDCSVSLATDSFVEFMRECLKSREDEEPEPLLLSHTTKAEAVSTSSPAAVMDLEQENNTIRALKELGSSQEDEEDNKTSPKSKTSEQEKKSPQPQPHADVISSPTFDSPASRHASETPLSKEVEAIDVWVAEAYHLAEHVLAAILTHLSVKDLVYWRDPKKSGVVFGVSMLLLLSLAAFSIVSVVSYILLALLCVTISFRIYKSVVQAVQKSGDGHPFKAFMEKDVSVPPETFRKHVDQCLTYVNRALKQMSRLFLVEDLVDSLKLAVAMWLLTYVGAVFNGITILILADILIFTLPLVYEKNKTQIDKYVDIARTQINTTMAKLQEKLPASMKRGKTE